MTEKAATDEQYALDGDKLTHEIGMPETGGEWFYLRFSRDEIVRTFAEHPGLIPDRARIDALQAENKRLRVLCVKSDGLLGLWRYRFKSTPMPDVLIGEIEEHIGNLRRASKGEV